MDSGNFHALLNFRVDSGDEILKEHFPAAPKNATYISESTQNEIISCCADIVNKQIMSEIKHSKYFSILADEVADCSNKEQMPIVFRYVDSNNTIKERFSEFAHK